MSIRPFFLAIVWACLMGLVGCEPSERAAPVSKLAQTPKGRDHYQVRPGDTLYSIAWAYGLDPKLLAKANDLDSLDAVRVDQVLHIPSKSLQAKAIAKKHAVVHRKARHHAIHKAKEDKAVPMKPIEWHRPLKGGHVKLAPSPYHGLLIGNGKDRQVKAAAPGRVVYSGNGVRGYGYLVLLDHGVGVLSAYGFNASVFVKVGDRVKAGDILATVGSGPMPGHWLYFEVRKQGRPVEPRSVLAQIH